MIFEVLISKSLHFFFGSALDGFGSKVKFLWEDKYLLFWEGNSFNGIILLYSKWL